MIIKGLAAIGVVIALFLTYVAFQPADYKIAREEIINASPETLFPYINNPKLTDTWMPWVDTYPDLEMVYSGPAEGVGAKSTWNHQGEMGEGEALVVGSTPNQSVTTKLSYKRPMEMEQLATLSLTPSESGTLVRWEVEGKNSFFGIIICVFFDMDEMIGTEFSKGLTKLKKVAEGK